jgi:hypothetical protein
LGFGFVPTFAARRPARTTLPAIVVLTVAYTFIALFVVTRIS